MTLIPKIEKAILELCREDEDRNVWFYIKKWHHLDRNGFDYEENFTIHSTNNILDLTATLHGIDCETLLRMAIDLGVETPNFIPMIPTFRNELKSDYTTAYSTFEKAFKEIETEPSLAIGLANSALESIIKEILKDERINSKISKKGTLHKITEENLKIFKMHPNSDIPVEINTIGSALISINDSIEKLRSEKTNFHGKTTEDYLIKDPLYAYFVVNSVTTVGLFLKSYYIKKFPNEWSVSDFTDDELPF